MPRLAKILLTFGVRCGAAVFIEGRGAQLLDPDSTVQNWESGIAVTVIGCTLFRNFAGWGGTLIVINVWPLISTVVRTDFIHNEALVVNNEWVYWTAPVRPRENFMPVLYVPV